MKRILGAALGVLAASGGAFAADVSAPVLYKAPVPTPAPAYSWTGLYVGGHVGGAWSSNDWFLPNDPLNSVAQQPLGTPFQGSFPNTPAGLIAARLAATQGPTIGPL